MRLQLPHLPQGCLVRDPEGQEKVWCLEEQAWQKGTKDGTKDGWMEERAWFEKKEKKGKEREEEAKGSNTFFEEKEEGPEDPPLPLPLPLPPFPPRKDPPPKGRSNPNILLTGQMLRAT